MKSTLLVAVTVLALACSSGNAGAGEGKHPMVLMSTSLGDIKIELYEDKAPVSVKNFLAYVKSGHYDGTIFHRVIPNFMIQGGGFDKEMQQKPTQAAIKNEAGNGLENDTGTLAMARTNDVNSATAQFFINVRDNDALNHRDNSPGGFGYAVFGRVVEGMDIVRKIERVPTTTQGMYRDVPAEAVVIKSVKALSE